MSDSYDFWIFSTDFRHLLKFQISWQSVQWEPSWAMRTDGQTDRQTDMTKPVVDFRNFVNAPRNCRFSFETKIIFMGLTSCVLHSDDYKIWLFGYFLGINVKLSFWYFSDRASQYIYLNINQLDALNFIMSLFHTSTCFEHMCSSSGRQNCTIQPPVSSHWNKWVV